MGLDTYLARDPKAADWLDSLEPGHSGLTAVDLAALTSLDPPLCEWVVDGDWVSFRGKVYDQAVAEAAETGLYRDWIPPAEVAAMAAAFAACDPEAVAASVALVRYQVSAREVRALGALFALCAERGIGLIGA